jgi:hypothetical protein
VGDRGRRLHHKPPPAASFADAAALKTFNYELRERTHAADQRKSSPDPTTEGTIMTLPLCVQSGRVAVDMGLGVVVYPPVEPGGAWRAVFTEGGRRRFRQAADEAGLAVKLEPALERLAAGAVHAERLGEDLVAYYLDPDRLPVHRRWSRKHAHTQARLCQRFALPVIAAVACQDIAIAHMQQIVNDAPTPGEGTRTRGMISALVAAGLDGGYLTTPRLAAVHWQPAGRPSPIPSSPSPASPRCGLTPPRSPPTPTSPPSGKRSLTAATASGTS